MYTAHVDRFALERMPVPEALPELRFDLPELRYPERLNAAHRFLERHVRAGFGDRLCMIDAAGERWTYAQTLERCNCIANVLVTRFGFVPGARVLLRAPNSPMLAACWLAVLKAGGIVVNTMPLYRAAELRYMIEKARITLAICDARLVDDLEAARADAGTVQLIAIGSGDTDALERLAARAPASFDDCETFATDIALIAFTSGSTGSAKATLHTHRDLLAVCDTYARRVLRAKVDDLFCGSPPLAFTFGLGGLLLFPLDAGAATLFLEKAGPEDLLRAVAEFGVTTLFTAPVAYRTMSSMIDRYDVTTLGACISAGETLPAAVWERWHAQTGVKILDGIGSTEMLHIFVGSPAERARAGFTGEVVPGYVAEVHDDDGCPLPPGEVGRLAVKGPTGCKYLHDLRQSAYVRRGWNYPGDAYRMDEQGYFSYVARTDDMIVSAGYNISGPEVEQALLTHPRVKECAVVAKPDPQHGTSIVKAYVVLEPGGDRGAAAIESLREHVRRAIAPYKAPREIEFVDDLPRTETGKLQRFKLRERAISEVPSGP
jgi:2-aminobenzoate-CoA ligase